MNNLPRQNISFWSADLLRHQDVVIVGGGIVGLSAAIELKEMQPHRSVAILDKGDGRLGASVRNAGFACFGSMTEVLDDIQQYGEETAQATVAMRWQGLQLLRARVGDTAMDYQASGGFEIFADKAGLDHCVGQTAYLNGLLAPIVQYDHCYRKVKTAIGTGIENQLEGVLNPAKMIAHLHRIAASIGVAYYPHVEVLEIESNYKQVVTTGGKVEYQTCIVCTNAWTKQLLPTMNILPARNHVLVTKPLANCPIEGAYHMDRGYVYFRNIGSRILIGGARHIDLDQEETYDLETANHKIESQLKYILDSVILNGTTFEIEHAWMGLLGVGGDKQPIIKKHGDGIYIAAKMGGMGIAIGSYVGRQVAELVLEES